MKGGCDMAVCSDCGRDGFLRKRMCGISFLYEFLNKDPKHEVWIYSGPGQHDTTVYTQGGQIVVGKKIPSIDAYVDRDGMISCHIHRGRPIQRHNCKARQQRIIEKAARVAGCWED